MIYVVKNIKAFYENKKGIFIFFLISLFVTSFFGLYVYAQYESSTLDITNVSQLKDSAIYIDPTSDFDYAEFEDSIQSQLEKLNIKTYVYVFNIDADCEEYDPQNELATEESSKLMAFPVASKEMTEVKHYDSMLYIGEGISEKDLKDGNDVCILTGSFMTDTVPIQGVDYTVKGVYDASDELSMGLIPYKSVRKNAMKPDRIAIILNGIDYKNYITVTAETIRKLENIFPEYSIESTAKEGAYSIRISRDKFLSNGNIMLIGMMMLVLLTLCSLYSYIFNLREAKYAIFKICGAGSFDIARICLVEMMILYTLCFSMAAGIFALLNKTVLYKYQPGFAFKVRPLTYLVCYLFMLLLMLLVFGIFSFVKGRTPPVRMLADGKLLD